MMALPQMSLPASAKGMHAACSRHAHSEPQLVSRIAARCATTRGGDEHQSGQAASVRARLRWLPKGNRFPHHALCVSPLFLHCLG